MSDADTIAALRAQLATVRAAAKQLEASFATRDAYERRKRELEDKPPPEEDDSALQAMLSKGTLQ